MRFQISFPGGTISFLSSVAIASHINTFSILSRGAPSNAFRNSGSFSKSGAFAAFITDWRASASCARSQSCVTTIKNGCEISSTLICSAPIDATACRTRTSPTRISPWWRRSSCGTGANLTTLPGNCHSSSKTNAGVAEREAVVAILVRGSASIGTAVPVEL